MMVQILDVLIGVAVVFLIFSTVASSAAELIEVMVRRRSKMLLLGIREIFRMTSTAAAAGTDKSSAGDVDTLVRAFYQLAPIASLYVGDLKKKFSPRQLPSYMTAERFATAILNAGDDTVAARVVEEDKKKLKEATGQILTVALKLYNGMAAQESAATLDVKRAALEKFFNDNGERMTGWYRRHVQWVLAGVGFVLAVAFNVNTLQIIKTLSEDDVLRTRIVSQALADIDPELAAVRAAGCAGENSKTTTATDTDDAAGDLQCEQKLREDIKRRLGYAHALGLPIGWREDTLPSHTLPLVTQRWSWLGMVLGWLLTALAVCVGAPFWFDLVSQLANVRTAIKPSTDPPTPPKPATQ